ncbi:MAG: hypothetical protein C5B51_12195 [Terriglobia bacterium]|nr:MAG: hypothetical protein C5B51_12195 [Terriglobia bacterium]
MGWENWPANRELLYVVDAFNASRGALVFTLMTREPKRAGGWKKPAFPRLVRSMIFSLPPADRQIMGLLAGVQGYNGFLSASPYEALATSYRVLHPLSATIMPLIAATGRAMLQLVPHSDDLLPLAWDDGEPWQFRLRLACTTGNKCSVTGHLHRGDEELDLSEPVLVTDGGFVFTRGRVARLAEGSAFDWLSYFRKVKCIEAPDSDAEQLLAAILEHPSAASLEVPEKLRYQELSSAARPCLTIRAVKPNPWEQERLQARLEFEYSGRRVPDSTGARGLYDPASRTFLVRDLAGENAAESLLRQLGFSELRESRERIWTLPPKKLPAVARACLEAGWHIEAEGRTFRRAQAVRVAVSSGVDWFGLHGEVDYGETTVRLPALLAALKRGEKMVRLDDGTYGLLPEDWLNRFGALAGLGTSETDHVRFRRNQAGLLDALLAAQPEVTCDETFARVRTAGALPRLAAEHHCSTRFGEVENPGARGAAALAAGGLPSRPARSQAPWRAKRQTRSADGSVGRGESRGT